METVRKIRVVAAELVGGALWLAAAVAAAVFALAALVAAMTAAPILAAAVVLGLFASVFLMNDVQQAEFLAFIRLMCGEPTAPRLREQSPYAAVRRAAGLEGGFSPRGKRGLGQVVVRPSHGGSSYNAADHHSDPAPKVSPYEARPEGDDKHNTPPLELREPAPN